MLFHRDPYNIDLLHRFTLPDTLIAAGCYIGILLAYYIMGCEDMSMGIFG